MDKCEEILKELDKQVKQLRPPQFEVGKKLTVMLPVRDGTKLYTRFVFPKGVEKGIVTFQRTCYDFQIPILEWMACHMAERGYISGYQLSRGIGPSEGEWVPFVHERNDGKDTIQWLQEQRFAEQIGLYGLSYGGYTQWLIADCLPEKVKTLVVVQAGVDRYHSLYANGCFRHDVYTAWALENAGFNLEDFYPQCCLYRPFADMDENVLGIKLPWFEDWLLHSEETDEYWQKGMWNDLKQIPSKIRVPVCLIGGWYDHHLEGMYFAWDHLQQNVREQSRFLIGPWLHGLQNGVDAYKINDHTHDCCFGFNEAFRWLDDYFNDRKCRETGLIGYMIGKDSWIHGDNNGQTDNKQIKLIPEGVTKFLHDPKRPLLACGGESMLYAPPEIRGSRRKDTTHDERICVYDSSPLQEEISVCGSIEVQFSVTSDCEDSAIVIKVMEEFHSGEAYHIRNMASTFQVLAQTAKSRFQPGERINAVLRSWPVMWTFQKGSKIRIEFSSSHFPEYHVHTNTAGQWARQNQGVIAVNQIFGDVLVVLPKKDCEE